MKSSPYKYNRAGFMPDGPKTMVVMLEKDLKGTAKAKNNIRGIPGRYTWGSLANWAAIGSGMGVKAMQSKDPAINSAMIKLQDYIFGQASVLLFLATLDAL